MPQVKAILTKPLDGWPEGAEREFERADFDRLQAQGAVKAASDDAGASEPQQGNVITDDVVKVFGVKADDLPPMANVDKPVVDVKAAPTPSNKAAPPVANKAKG